jgi:hypothetical protein
MARECIKNKSCLEPGLPWLKAQGDEDERPRKQGSLASINVSASVFV